MVKRVLLLGLAVVFVFSLSGCATTRKNNELEIQGLRNQVTALESQLRIKDEELRVLKTDQVPDEAVLKSLEVKQHANGKQIQMALKNAGYYQGVVDGKVGKSTREAIKAFQKANNLPIDGKVGKKTWILLKSYLEKKEK